jgi:class 3 adenylate cyclase
MLAIGILAVFAVRISQFLGKQHAIIAREREISDQLLENILPAEIAKRMKAGEVNIVDGYDSVAILFADIAGFTKYSEKRTPEELVRVLDQIFSLFDGLARKNGLEKIKTIGDSYMAASGLPGPNEAYLENMANFALDLKNEFAVLSLRNGFELEVRIGIHCGRVVAGVIGREKFLYDVWGDVVNTASRMESHGHPGMVHCSEKIYEQLNGKFDFKARGIQEIKGKGPMPTYFLIGKSES